MSYDQTSLRLTELRELLENKEFSKKLLKSIKNTYEIAVTLFDNYDQVITDDDSIRDWHAMNDDEKWTFSWYASDEIRIELFDDHVFSKLRMPWIIYPNELKKEFSRTMFPGGCGCLEMREIDFENLYQAFVHIICLHIISPQSKKISLCSLETSSNELSETSSDDPFIENYEKQDIKICFNVEKKEFRSLLTAEINCYMSSIAMDRLADDLSYVLKTAIHSIELLGKNPEYDIQQGSVSSITVASLQAFPKMIHDYLDTYFAHFGNRNSPKKDNFDRRICNAVQLLIEADRQRNLALQLALSVASIEALVGINAPELAEKLAENIATLLEPEVSERRKPMDFFKDLYNKRSKALHGEVVEGESEYQNRSRHIASAVLAAILDRRRFFESAQFEREKREDLINPDIS